MDAISRLPDEVLGRILSLISIKEAASTSVLSKRWNNVFVLVSSLDIDDRDQSLRKKTKRKHQNFMAFVDKLLNPQCGSSIKKLTLRSHVGVRGGTDSTRVRRWIRNVLESGVVDLDLFITLKVKSPPVPSLIFRSKTLVKLRLGRGFTIKLSQDVYLPMLRTLCLDSVNFDGDDHNVVGTLLSRCPVLEELVVDEQRWINWTCSVSSSSLKRLHMRFDRTFTSISLDAPNVVYYKHSGYVLGKYPNVKLDSLFEARLNLRMDEIKMQGVKNGSCLPADMINLINGIRHVRVLHLSSHTIELLYFSCRKNMPLFDSLVSLSIGSDKERGWQVLPLLIRNSPNLETLIFMGLDHYITNKCGDACVCNDTGGENITSCLSSSQVKVLEILSY